MSFLKEFEAYLNQNGIYIYHPEMRNKIGKIYTMKAKEVIGFKHPSEVTDEWISTTNQKLINDGYSQWQFEPFDRSKNIKYRLTLRHNNYKLYKENQKQKPFIQSLKDIIFPSL